MKQNTMALQQKNKTIIEYCQNCLKYAHKGKT